MHPELIEYKGALHVHTRYSDGSGTLTTVVDAAHEAELDYCIITDHNTLRHKFEGAEGWYDGTLILVGEEVSPRRNHYVAVGITGEIEPDEKDTQRTISEVRRQGGLGFIAHGHAKRKISVFIRNCSWSAWDADFDGIELWSYMFDWLRPVNALTLPYYLLNPSSAVRGPDEEALTMWDKLTQQRRVIAVGGVDAHAAYLKVLPFVKAFPYARMFRSIRTHILCPAFSRNLADDSKKIYNALREGCCFVAYDTLGASDGFRFFAQRGSEEVQMGSHVTPSGDLKLIISSPMEANLRLVRSGELVAEVLGRRLEVCAKELPPCSSEREVYRAEAHLGRRPWIFSNPIYAW